MKKDRVPPVFFNGCLYYLAAGASAGAAASAFFAFLCFLCFFTSFFSSALVSAFAGAAAVIPASLAGAASAATAVKETAAKIPAISTDNSLLIVNSSLSQLRIFGMFADTSVSLPTTYCSSGRLTTESIILGAGGGNRTPTPFQAPDFESGTSTSSITPARRGALSMKQLPISTTIAPLQ